MIRQALQRQPVRAETPEQAAAVARRFFGPPNRRHRGPLTRPRPPARG